jgi:hypothetical protein
MGLMVTHSRCLCLECLGLSRKFGVNHIIFQIKCLLMISGEGESNMFHYE